MAIELLYFASLREKLGVERESVDWTPAMSDLGALLTMLRARGGVWREVFEGKQPVMMAVNQEMAKLQQPLADGDEVGLFPPVTGG